MHKQCSIFELWRMHKHVLSEECSRQQDAQAPRTVRFKTRLKSWFTQAAQCMCIDTGTSRRCDSHLISTRKFEGFGREKPPAREGVQILGTTYGRRPEYRACSSAKTVSGGRRRKNRARSSAKTVIDGR